jgi:hypothetical protein
MVDQFFLCRGYDRSYDIDSDQEFQAEHDPVGSFPVPGINNTGVVQSAYILTGWSLESGSDLSILNTNVQ